MGNKILKYIYNLSVIFPIYTLFYLITMFGIWYKNNELTNNRIIIFGILLIIVILFTIFIIYIFMYHIKIIPQINIFIITANKKKSIS